jgi:hypothetical protein
MPGTLRVRSFLLAAAMVSLAAACARAAADDDDLIDDVAAPQDGRQVFVIRNVANIDGNIDAWIFGNRRNGDTGEQILESSLKTKVNALARAMGLSEAQKEKLVLAGEGDIRRFIDRIDALKLKYHKSEFSRDEWRDLFEEIRPLQTALRTELFGANSLISKTLNKMLTPEQLENQRRAVEERRAFHYRAQIEMTVLHLVSFLGLRDDQRKQLVQLLLETTQPPDSDEQRFEMVILAQMRSLREERLKPIFDAGQWGQMQQLFNRVAHMSWRAGRGEIFGVPGEIKVPVRARPVRVMQ